MERVLELKSVAAELSSKLHYLEEMRSRSLLGTGGSGLLDSGDTAWMMAASTFVLSMTIPGLALYFSGMVDNKNVLTTVMQCFSITGLITFLWLCFGYSLAFGPANASQHSSPVFGDASRFWLDGLTLESFHQLAPQLPESVFCMYELTFAIITPALICGSFAERMKYGSMLLYIALWHFIVYCPVAHSVWHPEGFLYKAGLLDFAGGIVVHIACGYSGLVFAIMLGPSKTYKDKVHPPHNILLTAVGTAMLWIGWYGFNAGSALAANGRAANALLMTQISTGVSALSWLGTESLVVYMNGGIPTVSTLAILCGAVAGLIGITPASGYVDATGAFFIGLLAGSLCYIGVQIKKWTGFDDAMDAFGLHAIGGTIGTILCGFFATDYVDGSENGVFYAGTKVGGTQLGIQIYGVVVSAGWSIAMSYILLKIIKELFGLNAVEEVDAAGRDEELDGSARGSTRGRHAYSAVEEVSGTAAPASPNPQYRLNAPLPTGPAGHIMGHVDSIAVAHIRAQEKTNGSPTHAAATTPSAASAPSTNGEKFPLQPGALVKTASEHFVDNTR